MVMLPSLDSSVPQLLRCDVLLHTLPSTSISDHIWKVTK